jgi:hypothetical protein
MGLCACASACRCVRGDQKWETNRVDCHKWDNLTGVTSGIWQGFSARMRATHTHTHTKTGTTYDTYTGGERERVKERESKRERGKEREEGEVRQIPRRQSHHIRRQYGGRMGRNKRSRKLLIDVATGKQHVFARHVTGHSQPSRPVPCCQVHISAEPFFQAGEEIALHLRFCQPPVACDYAA